MPPDDEVGSPDVEQRFEQFVQRFHAPLLRHVSVVYPDVEAAAIVNETFALAWRHFANLPAQHLDWLRRTARHVVFNDLRQRRRAAALTQRLASLRSHDVEPPADSLAPVVDEVVRALASLSRDDQYVLRLSASDDLTAAESAAVLEVSENAAAVRLHRARKRLKRAVERTRDAAGEVTP